ncbi:hypothetical protein ACP70R_047580 [Stipagrostis hirtigluma subsp. patula]
MGNCQAAEAAAVVIQHPGGKVERLYGPATAEDVMRNNPGHYVALVVLRVTDPAADAKAAGGGGGGAKITKVKLLKPKDTLLLGQVYRLITSQEVAKAIQARRQDKMRRGDEASNDWRRQQQPQSQPERAAAVAGGHEQSQRSSDQERKRPAQDRHRSSGGGGAGRGRHWRPTLQSITESAS